MTLKAVRKTSEYKGAIAESTNYGLEEELLGFPLWLESHGHEQEALEVLQYIANQPRELFVRHIHRSLWDAYSELSNRAIVPSEAWIQQVLMPKGEWTDDESIPGLLTPGFLDDLREKGRLELTMKVGDSPMHAVRETTSELWNLYRRRKVVHAVEDLHEAVIAPAGRTRGEIGELIDQVQQVFSEQPEREETAMSFGKLVETEIAVLERQLDGEEHIRIQSGFPSLDRITGGFLPGNLVVLAARPAMGKTSLALDIAMHAARSNHLTAYFSFEMMKAELVRRILSKESRVNVLRMRHGNLEDWQFDQVRACCADDGHLPLILDDGNFTPRQIEAKLRDWNRHARPGKVEILILDHLQIAGATDQKRYERRDLQLAAYTAQLKDLAKRYNLVILLLSQLNRGIENRPQDQKAPRLADLRESGAIEADADCVIGLWRKHPDTQQPEDKAHAEICLLKNRSGPIGRLSLSWVPELAMFTDPKADDEQQQLETL